MLFSKLTVRKVSICMQIAEHDMYFNFTEPIILHMNLHLSDSLIRFWILDSHQLFANSTKNLKKVLRDMGINYSCICFTIAGNWTERLNTEVVVDFWYWLIDYKLMLHVWVKRSV